MPCRAALLLVTLVPVLASCGQHEDLPKVRLATTTSATDTGLLEWLKPEIRRVAQVELWDFSKGTGEALELAKRGDADLVIVHDRGREDAFVREGWGMDRRDLMWNDFVLVGPPEDPAGVKGGRDGAAALQALARAQVTFTSRGDKSGTHARELALWKDGGGRPEWPGYLESGSGQAVTLRLADEKRGYALADRGTFVKLAKTLSLVVLVEGDRRLDNPYGVILLDPAKVKGTNEAGARAVRDYLVSPEGQARIDAFRVDGRPVFHAGAPKD